MLPRLPHRILIGVCVILSALCWLGVYSWIMPEDAGTGLTLVRTDTGATLRCVGLVVLAGLPVVLLGVLSSTLGHPLAGVFSVSISLAALGWRGGSIDGWVYRMADANALPEAYKLLLIEIGIWQVLFVAMLATVQYLRSPMHMRWPALAFDDHLGVDTKLHWPQIQSIAAGLTCVAVAGVLAYFAVRSSDRGQVFWSLLICFTIGATVGQLIFPQTNPVGILFSPAVAALIGYAMVLIRFETQDDFLRQYYLMTAAMPGLARALPVDYASAAIAGCCMGVGLAQGLVHGARQVTTSPN